MNLSAEEIERRRRDVEVSYVTTVIGKLAYGHGIVFTNKEIWAPFVTEAVKQYGNMSAEHLASVIAKREYCPACHNTKTACKATPACHIVARVEARKTAQKYQLNEVVDIGDGNIYKIVDSFVSTRSDRADQRVYSLVDSEFGGAKMDVVEEEIIEKVSSRKAQSVGEIVEYSDRDGYIVNGLIDEILPDGRIVITSLATGIQEILEDGSRIKTGKKAQDGNYEMARQDIDTVNQAIENIVSQWVRFDPFTSILPAGALDGIASICEKILGVVKDYRGW